MEKKAPEYVDLFTASTDEEFESALDALLEKAVRHLEKNKVNFESLNEVALSAVLVGALSLPGLSVTQENIQTARSTSLWMRISAFPHELNLGEAKIYDGPQQHIEGLGQLLERYTTGREGRGLLIEYFKKRNIKGLVEKLRQQLNTDLPLQQRGPCLDHKLKWSFITTHGHDSGEDLQVGHIGCNLHLGAPGDE